MKHKQLVTAIGDLTEQVIAHSETDIDNTVVDELQAALEEVDPEAEADKDKLVDAVLGVLEEIAELTPTETDDTVLGFAKIILGSFGTADWISEKWAAMRAKGKARRAARRED